MEDQPAEPLTFLSLRNGAGRWGEEDAGADLEGGLRPQPVPPARGSRARPCSSPSSPLIQAQPRRCPWVGLGAVAPGDTLFRKPGPEDPGRQTGLRCELFYQLPAGVQSVFVCLSKILYFFLSIFVLTAVLTLDQAESGGHRAQGLLRPARAGFLQLPRTGPGALLCLRKKGGSRTFY